MYIHPDLSAGTYRDLDSSVDRDIRSYSCTEPDVITPHSSRTHRRLEFIGWRRLTSTCPAILVLLPVAGTDLGENLSAW
jgi:hypothetical protein